MDGRRSHLNQAFAGGVMLNRRECISLFAGTAGAALALDPELLLAAEGTAESGLIKREIPSSGEELPVVGLGSSASFGQVARSDDVSALKEVLRMLAEKGGTVLDTAPSYGASEEVAGKLAGELGVASRIFWATKVNVVRGGGGSADPAAARRQIEDSFRKFNVPKIDLIQVHNLRDTSTHLSVLREFTKQDRVRYVGVTTTNPSQYEELVQVMRNEPIHFIGIDYAVDNRDVENTILPLAQEKKIAVMVYLPFGRNSLFRRVGDRPLPDWAREFGATSWAQFFLKYVIAHPAVTVVTPATSKAKHMADNLAAATGKLPDEAMRKRMVSFIESLPAAG
jgi:aryl-alcohol dehydrogenase-like predicted oxidoreductase